MVWADSTRNWSCSLEMKRNKLQYQMSGYCSNNWLRLRQFSSDTESFATHKRSFCGFPCSALSVNKIPQRLHHGALIISHSFFFHWSLLPFTSTATPFTLLMFFWLFAQLATKITNNGSQIIELPGSHGATSKMIPAPTWRLVEKSWVFHEMERLDFHRTTIFISFLNEFNHRE